MAKTDIVPIKIVIDLNTDGTLKDGIMLYRLKHGTAIPSKTYTMGIKNGIGVAATNTLLMNAKDHVKKGEGIKEKKED